MGIVLRCGAAYGVPKVGAVLKGSLHGLDTLLVGNLAEQSEVFIILSKGSCGWGSVISTLDCVNSLIIPKPTEPMGFPAMDFGAADDMVSNDL